MRCWTRSTTAWAAGGVVLVEGSDLARADRYRPLATVDQQERLRRDALRRTDELVRRAPRPGSTRIATRCWWSARTTAGPGAPHGGRPARPGLEPGLLRSGSTRRAGFVTLVDIAPTILDLVGVERPELDGGTPVRAAPTGPSTGAARAD